MLKTTYFLPETLSSQSQAFLEACKPFQRVRAPRLDPPRAALLVLDMQAYFLDPGSHAYVPSAAAILPGICALVQAFARRRLPVYFSQHVNSPADAGQMSVWWRDLIQPGDPRSALVPEIDPSSGMLFQKSQYDAFYNTGLEDQLHSRQVAQVVICGVMTHLCCETTARSAFMRGFDVLFPVDGTATYNQTFHQSTLVNLAHGFAAILLVDDLLRGLDAPEGL